MLLATKSVPKKWIFVKLMSYPSFITLLLSIITYWYKTYKQQAKKVELKRSNLSLDNLRQTSHRAVSCLQLTLSKADLSLVTHPASFPIVY